MSRPKPRGPDTLDRWPGEGKQNHRALLLWAMQRPDDRSMRAVARSVAMGATTIRKWAARYRWEERASAPNAEEEAIRVYRDQYVEEWGKVDMPEIQPRCSFMVAAGKGAPPPSDVSETLLAARARQEVTKQLSQQRAAEEAQAEVDRRRGEQLNELKREHLLVEIGLAYIQGQIKDKKVRVNLRDIPALMEAKQLLRRKELDLSQSAGGETKDNRQVIVESARVRYAKANGGSVLRAMLEDTEELRTILGVLVAKEEHREEVSASEDLGLSEQAEEEEDE